ncbi:MAG: hypothetical protein Q8O07_03070 [Chloroflexota bacterium]|nr:hypothetical protein [Chloroflexota bacterium]
MDEITELSARRTIRLPQAVAARFRPSDRFLVWTDGDTVHLKRITPPLVTRIVESAPAGEPLVMEEISEMVHEVRRRRRSV